jgi:hypothetical protein
MYTHLLTWKYEQDGTEADIKARIGQTGIECLQLRNIWMVKNKLHIQFGFSTKGYYNEQ